VTLLWRLARAFLFLIDPERAHHLAHRFLGWLGRRRWAPRVRPRASPALEVGCLGLKFEHPLGLAAGFDKGEVHAAGLFALGFSHLEVGTITPRAQPGNPTPRLFRIPEHRALVNRMGFNNDGAETCAARLAALGATRPGVIGVNVGRARETPNERAEEDLLFCLDRLAPHADYLVVNLSSPNTPGLRALQAAEPLERLVSACTARLQGRAGSGPPKPLLVKVDPDLDPEALDQAVDVAIAAGVAGIVATNTTVSRPGLVARHRAAAEPGGLSGAPLEPLATAAVRRIYARTRGRVPVIGVGGIFGAADAYARIRAGATLIQLYTGLIYGGPPLLRRMLRELAALLRRDGFSRVEDAVGADHGKSVVGSR
jgi:dihydroorotate dehydrogenase